MRRTRVLLRMEEMDESIALPCMPLRARDCIMPGRRVGWIAGKEVGDARVIEGVVGRESANPREATDINGKPGAWSRVSMRAGVLWSLV